MIITQQLSKSFGRITVLNDISVSVHPGQSVALIGPNGSGKTTFIKCILGMVIPDRGKIQFRGKDIDSDCAYRNEIGYMPQIGRYPDNLKTGQLFEMMKDLRKSQKDIDEELIEAFDLRQIFHKPLRTLSGGTRQKVSAALAFLFKPTVLILDEPTAGLDPLSAEILKNKVAKEKNDQKVFLITSHIMSDLDELASDVMYLMEGKLQFFKSIEQIKKETSEEKLGRAIAGIMLAAARP